MYPSPFQYYTPKSVDEVVRLLREFGSEAKLIAGGHSLLPMMKLRLAAPEHLIDLSAVADLKGIFVDSTVRIGAMTTHWEVQSSPLLAQHLPFLCEAAGGIADPQVRNRGTIGGSLSHADPAADYAAIMLALRAELVCAGPRGQRTLSIDDWFMDLMTTALDDGEILKAVHIPLPRGNFGAAYEKHPHPASRFAMAGIAAAIVLDDDGCCCAASIGVTGLGLVPARAVAAEAAMIGAYPSGETIHRVAGLIDEDVDVERGFQMSADDKRQLARALAFRAIARAVEAAHRPPH